MTKSKEDIQCFIGIGSILVVLFLFPSILSISVSATHSDNECWDNDFTPPKWLMGYGICSAVITVISTYIIFWIECCTGSGGCGDTGSGPIGRSREVPLLTIAIISNVSWFVSGIYLLIGSDCTDASEITVFVAIIISLICQAITAILAGLWACISYFD